MSNPNANIGRKRSSFSMIATVLLGLMIAAIPLVGSAQDSTKRPAEKRLALLIGVSDISFNKMPEAKEDVRLMYKTLTSLGFDAPIEKYPLNQSQAKEAFKDLDDQIEAAMTAGQVPVVVVYFSGHAVQAANSTNPEDMLWLLPSLGNVDLAGTNPAVRNQIILDNVLYLRDVMPFVTGRKPARVFFFVSACREPSNFDINVTAPSGPQYSDLSWFMSTNSGGLSYLPNNISNKFYQPAGDAKPGVFTEVLAENLKADGIQYGEISSRAAKAINQTFLDLNLEQRVASIGFNGDYVFKPLAVSYSDDQKQEYATTGVKTETSSTPRSAAPAAMAEEADDLEPMLPWQNDLRAREIVPIIRKRGLTAIKASAARGIAQDQYIMSLVRYFGLAGETIDLDASMIWAKRAALGGHVEAAALIGYFSYQLGAISKAPVRQVFERETVAWNQVGYERGSLTAANNLGVSYMEGIGVSRSWPEAVKHLRWANDRKFKQAASNLAIALWEGDGQANKPNREAGFAIYANAIKSGNGYAAWHLGLQYLFGRDSIGLKADPVLADHYLERGVELGEVNAALRMAELSDNGIEGYSAVEPERATAYYQLAAALNSGTAWLALGRRYQTGKGLPTKDQEKAFNAFENASYLGLTEATFMKGEMLIHDWGIRNDPARAFYAFERVVDYDQHNPKGRDWPGFGAMAGAHMNEILRDYPALKLSPSKISLDRLRTDYALTTERYKFTVNAICGTGKSATTGPFEFYIFEWDREEDPTQMQFRWLERTSNCHVSASAKKGFKTLYSIFRENRGQLLDDGKPITFTRLVLYTLEMAKKPQEKPTTPVSVNTTTVIKVATVDDYGNPGYVLLETEADKLKTYMNILRIGRVPKAGQFFTVVTGGPDNGETAAKVSESGAFWNFLDLGRGSENYQDIVGQSDIRVTSVATTKPSLNDEAVSQYFSRNRSRIAEIPTGVDYRAAGQINLPPPAHDEYFIPDPRRGLPLLDAVQSQ